MRFEYLLDYDRKWEHVHASVDFISSVEFSIKLWSHVSTFKDYQVTKWANNTHETMHDGICRLTWYSHDAPFGGFARRDSVDRTLLLPTYSEAESYFGRLNPKSATFRCLASLNKLLKLPTASPHWLGTISTQPSNVHETIPTSIVKDYRQNQNLQTFLGWSSEICSTT